MGGLFSSPKTVEPPTVPDPEPIPEIGIDTDKKPSRRKHRGRTETVITGELEPVTTKKTLLG